MEYEIVRELAEIKNILAKPNYIGFIEVILSFVLGSISNEYRNRKMNKRNEIKERKRVLQDSINKLNFVENKFKSTITPFSFSAPFIRDYKPDEVDDILIDCIVRLGEIIDNLTAIDFSNDDLKLIDINRYLVNSKGQLVDFRSSNDEEYIRSKQEDYSNINIMFMDTMDVLREELDKIKEKERPFYCKLKRKLCENKGESDGNAIEEKEEQSEK